MYYSYATPSLVLSSKSESANDVVKYICEELNSEPIPNDPDTNEQHTDIFKLNSLLDGHESHPMTDHTELS